MSSFFSTFQTIILSQQGLCMYTMADPEGADPVYDPYLKPNFRNTHIRQIFQHTLQIPEVLDPPLTCDTKCICACSLHIMAISYFPEKGRIKWKI